MHWYGVMMALGFFLGLANWVWIGRKKGWDVNFCSDLLFWIMLTGIIGARTAYVIADFDAFRRAPLSILFIHQGGLIFYGGLIGGLLAILIFSRIRRVKLLALLDLVATSVPLGHALGRVGCLLNGCCHGKVNTGRSTVTYPAESLAWWHQVSHGMLADTAPRSLPVIPVQVYESILNLALYVLLVVVYRRQERDGPATAVYLLCYPCARFFTEFLRGDERTMWRGLSVAQALSLALIAAGAALLLKLLSAKRRSPPVPPEHETESHS